MRLKLILLLVVIMVILCSGQIALWALPGVKQTVGPGEQAIHAYNQYNLYYEDNYINQIGPGE